MIVYVHHSLDLHKESNFYKTRSISGHHWTYRTIAGLKISLKFEMDFLVIKILKNIFQTLYDMIYIGTCFWRSGYYHFSGRFFGKKVHRPDLGHHVIVIANTTWWCIKISKMDFVWMKSEGLKWLTWKAWNSTLWMLEEISNRFRFGWILLT